MAIREISGLLCGNAYPGRGILLGMDEAGSRAYAAYFIMGRSENSRNRVFTQRGGGIVTEAADPARLTDPSLVIYAPVRRAGGALVVTNGDQTDTLCEYLARGQSYADALRGRSYEPDAPNYTPRISGILRGGDGGFSYALSILKAGEGEGPPALRFFYEYPRPQAGCGHLIHTYMGDGEPLPSFCGEPRAVAVRGTLREFADGLWRCLNADNRVSLFARAVAAGGGEETVIINKYEKV